MTQMAERENGYFGIGSTAKENSLFVALVFMEIGAIIILVLQVKEFCVKPSIVPWSFIAVSMLNFIVSFFFTEKKNPSNMSNNFTNTT